MENILKTYLNDLDDIKKSIKLLDEVDIFKKTEVPVEIEEDKEFIIGAAKLNGVAKASSIGITILSGTVILYLGGRFEDFVRTTFEELCITIAQTQKEYIKLPKQMRENLIKFTATVIADPRKFGHAEKGRDTFIKNLSNNIHENDISQINVECLSITDTNMRPDALSDLFARIGLSNIWKIIGEQMRIRTFFGGVVSEKATSDARSYLNNFMNLRNSIAHPAGEIAWPNRETIIQNIEFFEKFSTCLLEISENYKIQVTKSEALI